MNRQTLFEREPSKRELAAVCAVSDYLAWDFIKEAKVVENTTPPTTTHQPPITDRYGAPIPEAIADNGVQTKREYDLNPSKLKA